MRRLLIVLALMIPSAPLCAWASSEPPVMKDPRQQDEKCWLVDWLSWLFGFNGEQKPFDPKDPYGDGVKHKEKGKNAQGNRPGSRR